MATTNLGLELQALAARSWHTLLNQNLQRIEDRLTAQFAGDPNGNVAGFWVGQWCYDTTNGVFYKCTTASGVAGTSVWASTAVNAAGETVAGIAEIATQTETNTGTDDARMITPKKLTEWSPASSIVTPAGGDYILIADVSLSGALKRALATDLVDQLKQTQSEGEGASANTAIVTPGTAKWLDGVAKGGVVFAGATGTIAYSFGNVSGVVKNAIGDYTISFSDDFDSDDYIITHANGNTLSNIGVKIISKAAGSCAIKTINEGSGGTADDVEVHLVFYGRLA